MTFRFRVPRVRRLGTSRPYLPRRRGLLRARRDCFRLNELGDLSSFPTRRSSDLDWTPAAAGRRPGLPVPAAEVLAVGDRKSTRLNSSHLGTSYAVFCLKKKSRTRQPKRMNTKKNGPLARMPGTAEMPKRTR